MKIKIYSLCRSGHHAISFWLAKNLVPNAAVDLIYNEGTEKVHMITGSSLNVLNLAENEHLKPSDEPTIIILRDPYNNYASFLKLVQNPNFGPLSFFPFMEFWKEYARECVGETNLLTNKIVISYNDWVNSEDYRRNIVNEIGNKFSIETKFDDSLKNKMTRYGGGSSFDGLDHIQSADKMRVHYRYKFYENHRDYRTKIDEPEVKAYAEKIFKYYPWKVEEKPKSGDAWRFLELMG